MPLNKKQLKRMVLFVGELKKNKYPNSYSFAKYLRTLDLDENINVACTPRTIQRDIRVLKEEFEAPLLYDYDMSGYTLKNPTWEFSTPVLGESEILAMVLGSRIAENILPEAHVKTQIIEAVAQQLTVNSNDLLETAFLEALIVCNHMTVDIDCMVFQTVFDAWRHNEAIDIEYTNAQERKSLRRVDPQILAFQDGAWFIKGYCHSREAIVTFAIHRIISATPTNRYFEHDKKLIETTKEEGLFNFKRVRDVILLCDERVINYARDYRFHPDQKIIPVATGKFELHIPSAPDDELVRWIMWQIGQVGVIKPKSLKERIIEYAERIKNASECVVMK
jgi:predicted DNA-binding transcriptional regulator YafY